MGALGFIALASRRAMRRPGNLPPIVNAGPDQSVSVGALVSLSGSATDPDGSISGVAWTKLSGPAATLSNAAILNPTFTPGSAGTYVWRLTATDNLGVPVYDDMQVTAGAGFSFTTNAWDASPLDGDGTGPQTITGYRVYYSQTPGFDWTTASYQDFDAPRTSANVSVASSGTWYYRVAAQNASGFGPPLLEDFATAS